jgi:hypothetical protein
MNPQDLKIIDRSSLDEILKDLTDLDGHFDNFEKEDVYRALVVVRSKLLNL